VSYQKWNNAIAGNCTLPLPELSLLGLDPVGGVPGRAAAKHLLERCLFGPKREGKDQFASLIVAEAMAILPAPKPEPSLPVNINPDDTDLPPGETWVNAPDRQALRAGRKKSLRSW
jgi:hypothetical protein